ncbi:hypothetical protein VZT92_023388 [Zoarces viviparus]|uniref:Uncharacterized protein n=1 Tax=Zoarces viviparus TaxID=48416 RepID=A0AAW1E636_ZOAVI
MLKLNCTLNQRLWSRGPFPVPAKLSQCRVPADHHQAISIKADVTAGPLLRLPDTGLKEQRRREGEKIKDVLTINDLYF